MPPRPAPASAPASAPTAARLRPLAVLLAAALLTACGHTPPRNPLATWVPSPNQDLRRPGLIVIHFTQQDSVQQSLDTLRGSNSGGRVRAVLAPKAPPSTSPVGTPAAGARLQPTPQLTAPQEP